MWNDRAITAHKQSKSDRKFPQMIGAIRTPVRDRLIRAIKREFEPFRFAAETLARAAQRTPRAARNWLSGNNAPDAEALIELMASCDSIADEVNTLVQLRRKEREGEKCRGLNCGSAASYGSATTAESHHSCM